MRVSLLRPGFALGAPVLLLLFTGDGACSSNTACFTYSPSQYGANGNRCPAPQDALVNLSDPQCPGSVVAVNGPGQFDGELCCYPVTFDAITPSCGTGGSGGASLGSSGTGPVPPGGPPAGVGGSVTCFAACSTALETATTPCGGLGLSLYLAVQACAGCGGASGVGGVGGGGGASGGGGAAGGGGAGGGGGTGGAPGVSCSSVCTGFCANVDMSSACAICLQDRCTSPIEDCEAN